MAAENRVKITITADGDQAVRTVRGLKGELSGAESAGRRASGGMRELSGSIDKTAASSRLMGTAIKGAMAYLAVDRITAWTAAMGRMMDQYTEMENQLRLSTNGQRELNFVMTETYDLAAATRNSWSATADLYARLERSTRDLSYSQELLLGVTKSVNQAVAISGANAASADAAIFQLGQGLGAGALRGEELNSVLEQTPRLAQAMADGLGVSIAELRRLGSEGELTAEKVVQALVSQADALDAEFQRTTGTMSQGWARAKDAAGRFFGELDDGLAVTEKATEVFGITAGAIDAVTDAMEASRQSRNSYVEFLANVTRYGSGVAATVAVLGKYAESQNTHVVSGLVDWNAVHEDQSKLDVLYRESKEKAAAWAKRRGDALTKAEQETIDEIIAAEKNAAQERKKIAEDLADAQAQATHQVRMESLREGERIRQLEEQAILDKLDEENRMEEAAAAERERIRKEEVKRAAREYEEQLEEQRKTTERAMQNIQDSMANTFYDIFKDIGNGWDSLWESMKNFALRMIANLAATAAMNAIVVPVFFQPSGGGDGGMLSGLMGGGGFPSFGGGGFNIPGMDWLSGIMSMNLPGTGSLFNSALYESGLPGVAAYGGSTATPGLSLGGALGYGAMGSLGYGLLGSMLGWDSSPISSLTSGVGGALGAWGGSILPMLGAAGGPIGAVLGALGGGLLGDLFGGGGLFGGKEHSPSVIYQQQNLKWGQTDDFQYHLKSGGSDEVAAQINEFLSQTTETLFSDFEDILGAEYTDMLEGLEITFGRHAGGAWDAWDWGSDHDFEALMEMAAEDLASQIAKAASYALDKAGKDILSSDDFTETWARLSKERKEELQDLIDDVAEGLLGEEAQKMAEEIQALQDELAKIGDGAQASNAVDELNKQIAELMKKIAESVEAEDALKYAEQLQKLKDLLGGLQGAWDTVQDAIEQILNPMSEVARITQNANDMIDQWIETLRELGFAEEELAKIEEKRQEIIDALLAKMKKQFDTEMRLREEQLYGSDASIEYLRLQMQHEQELADVIAKFGAGSEQHLRLLALHAEEMAHWHRYMEYQTKVVARETWEGAANAYLDALRNELAELQNTFDRAKSAYVSALRDALAELQAEYDAAKQTYLDLLHEEINAYKALANTLSQAINQIETYRRSMWVGQESPLSSYDQMRYLRGVYQSSMSEAMSGDRDALGRVASDASGYLTASRALSTDPIAYAREFAKANLQLLAAQAMAEDELSDTQKMIALLEDIVAETEGTKENVTDLDEARTQYEELRKRLDENWFERELYAIEGTNFGVEDLNKLQADYYAAKRALDTRQHSEHIAKLESLLGYTASIEQLLADFLESGGFEPPPDPTPPDPIGSLLQDSGFKDIASVYGKINPDWTSGGQAWTYSALNRAVGQSLANLPDTTDEQVKAWGIGKTKSQFESDLNYLSSLLDQVRAGDMLFGDPSGYKSMRNEDYYKTIAQRYGWPSQGALEDQVELRQGIDDSLDKIAEGDDAMRAFLDSVGLTHVTTQQWYNDIHWLDGVLGQVESGLRRFATGGIATGPRTGYLAELHGTEAVVPLSNGRSIPVTLGAGEITSELRELRADLNRIGAALAKHTSDGSKYLERWEYGGMPATREAVA